MEDLLQNTLEGAGPGGTLAFAAGPDALVFLLIAALGLLMALVYVPVRLFLTVTARSRRLRLLQRIRRLREELGQSVKAPGQPQG